MTSGQEEELGMKFTSAREILLQMDSCGATVIASDKLDWTQAFSPALSQKRHTVEGPGSD